MQTDWEDAYQTGDTPWEKGRAHPELVRFVAAEGRPPGKIVVPGCGFGHDVRALSSGENEVLGVDLAPYAFERAQSFPRVGNERYLLADLFALPQEMLGAFDVVFEHTCFCALDPVERRRYVTALTQLLKPGGKLVAIFFLDPDLVRDGPPYGVERAELSALFDPHFTIEREWIPLTTYPGRENRELMSVRRLRASDARETTDKSG